jgi:hypothetical protein
MERKIIYSSPFVYAFDQSFDNDVNNVYEFVLHGANVNDELLEEVYANGQLVKTEIYSV